MSYPEFSDFPPIPQRSAAEADFDTKMSALFQHFATTHRAELIALIDFLKTNSTIIGGALNATTVGLDTPAEGKFTALEAPQLDLINTVSGVLAVLGASASDLNIGTNSNHPVDLRVAGIRSILLSTNGTKSFYLPDGSTVAVSITPSGALGLGTSNPDELLHVVGNSLVQGNSLIKSGFPQLILLDGGSTGGGDAGGNLILRDESGNSNVMTLGVPGSNGDVALRSFYGDLAFATDNGGNPSEHMRLTANGNLGLGTASATVELEVRGQATFGGTPVGSDATVAVRDSGATSGSVSTRNDHASYAGAAQTVNVVRAASSAYQFYQAYSGNFGDLEFKLSGNGNGTCDGAWTGGGADYAEYFEWADGNPGHEDRRGLSVVLDGDKIRPALPDEDPIGVISANPSVVGDGDIDRWKGKYLRDAFGAYIWEDYEALSWSEVVTETETVQEQASKAQERTREVIEVADGVAVKTVVTETVQVPLFDEFPLVDEAGQPIMVSTSETLADGSQNIIEVQAVHREPRMAEVQRQTTREIEHSYAADEVPDGVAVPADAERVTQQRRKLNPDYDPSQEYTPRADRPEWDTVGLMGKLRLLKGQPTGARWIKMRDVSADVEEWLVR